MQRSRGMIAQHTIWKIILFSFLRHGTLFSMRNAAWDLDVAATATVKFVLILSGTEKLTMKKTTVIEFCCQRRRQFNGWLK